MVANPSHKTPHQINRPATNSIHESIVVAIEKHYGRVAISLEPDSVMGLVNQYLERARGRAIFSAGGMQILPS